MKNRQNGRKTDSILSINDIIDKQNRLSPIVKKFLEKELKNIPSETEIAEKHTFSDEFLKKMQRLISGEDN